jgi:CPA1 family monovalent cation:H+ antiporter
MQANAESLDHLELILLMLLTFVAGFTVLARRIGVPYPIVLVIGGLMVSFIPRVPRISLNPDVVFLIFLPPLLFSASLQISWRDFRNNLLSLLLLAFGLVGFTIYGVAVTTKSVLPGFTWKLGLVLGAVVATTDAIAATSTAKRLGLPRSITDLLEAESLLNDGSGLVALNFTTAMLVTGVTPSLAEGAARLLYLIVAAFAIGLLIGMVVRLLQTRISDAPVEITITVMAAYVTYLAAEAAHCSGVLATIACGLYLGRHSSGVYSLKARMESEAFWNTLDFILNGLVFLLLGLQLPAILSDIRGIGTRQLIWDGILFSAIVIVLRLIWVFPAAWLSGQVQQRLWKGTRKTGSSAAFALLRGQVAIGEPRRVFLVGWAGMRGVLALTAAISLPTKLADGSPFPQRSLIIFLAFCVIFATLVLQGLSMPWLIRRLGLGGSSETKEDELLARRQMMNAAIRFLEDRKRVAPEDKDAADVLESYYRRELGLFEKYDSAKDGHDLSRSKAWRLRTLAQDARSVERSVALQLRRDERIHDEVLRRLERELDWLDARFEEAE